MTEIAGTAVHEAYSFACMRCAHGWEQAYEIEHHIDAEGHTFVVYLANGIRVPSPLTRPTCLNCGEHVVRIMRSGQVATALVGLSPPAPKKAPVGSAEDPLNQPHHHWHFADLLHVFHRK